MLLSPNFLHLIAVKYFTWSAENTFVVYFVERRFEWDWLKGGDRYSSVQTYFTYLIVNIEIFNVNVVISKSFLTWVQVK